MILDQEKEKKLDDKMWKHLSNFLFAIEMILLALIGFRLIKSQLDFSPLLPNYAFHYVNRINYVLLGVMGLSLIVGIVDIRMKRRMVLTFIRLMLILLFVCNDVYSISS